MTKELTEKEKKAIAEKEAFDALVKKEEGRTEMEKYHIKQLGKWSVPLLVVFLLYFIYLVGSFINSQINDLEMSMSSYEWGFLVFLVIFSGIYLGVEESWNNVKKAKDFISQKNHNYKWKINEDGYIYTDSMLEVISYRIVKIVISLFNLLLGLIIIYFLFGWLENNITTTGVIITLLIIIIALLLQLVLNQKNK